MFDNLQRLCNRFLLVLGFKITESGRISFYEEIECEKSDFGCKYDLVNFES